MYREKNVRVHDDLIWFDDLMVSQNKMFLEKNKIERVSSAILFIYFRFRFENFFSFPLNAFRKY